MDHAFISYASEDRAVANKVCSTLEGAGLTCWIAPRDIPPSQDYGGAISEAIEKSRVVILLVSRTPTDPLKCDGRLRKRPT